MSNVLNVLSIDMDYIMQPCIEVYNNQVGANEKKSWDLIMDLMGDELQEMPFKSRNLTMILDQFNKHLKDNTVVIFANDHDSILYELTKEKYYNNKFNVLNIDHHHDISYNPTSSKDVEKYDIVTPGTWVLYLDKYRLLNQYHWFKNDNSTNYTGPEINANVYEYDNHEYFQILDNTNIDIIFVCLSPQWTPRKYDNYFITMMEQCERVLGRKPEFIDLPFGPNEKSKPYKKEE